MTGRKHVLLATLGGQPQIVTFTLDLLLLTYPISDVFVIHPDLAQERLRSSFERLKAEFTDNVYQNRPMNFHSHVLKHDGELLADIRDDSDADGVLDTIHRLIAHLKQQGHHIHLSVSGGRRLMGLLAISVAALNFDRDDHIWHIYTPQELTDQAREEKIMHVPPTAGIKLIAGQFISLGAFFHPSSSFHRAQAEQQSQVYRREKARCEAVWQAASSAQRRVLQAFGWGLSPQQVADQLSISLATVNTHRSALLELCRDEWQIAGKERIDFHFLQARFAHYFDHDS